MNKLLMTMLCGAVMSIAAQTLELIDGDALGVRLGDNILVSGEEIKLYGDTGIATPQCSTDEIDGAIVKNLYGEESGYKFRREIVLREDNAGIEGAPKVVEINIQNLSPAYDDAHQDKRFKYGIKIPFEKLVGAEYTIIDGRASGLTETKGSFSDTANGGLSLNTARSIYINGALGNIMIDCDPKGINCHGDYGPTAVVGRWNVKRVGENLEIYLLFSPKFYGGSVSGKLLIAQAGADAYDIRHAVRSYSYFQHLPAVSSYAFASDKHGAWYTSAQTEVFDADKGYGWLDNAGMASEKYAEQGALYAAVHGEFPATFMMSAKRPGFHLITVAASAGDKAVGPFAIGCNSKKYAENVTVEPKTVKTITFGAWIENGSAAISFEPSEGGSWCVSTISDQLLQSSAEDYTFRRGFWFKHGGPFPGIMYRDESYAKEPAYGVKIETYERPEPGTEMSAPLKQMAYPTAYAEFDNPEEDWRWKATISPLGPGNNGTFDEYSNPEKLLRRLDELKEKKIKVLMTNGLLSRHTFESHEERVNKFLCEVTKLSHERGINVVDHIDFSLLWNEDGGFRNMVERMPHLLVTIDNHQVERGLCLTNPNCTEYFMSRLEKLYRESGMDGLMVDEACFQLPELCGCEHCRKAFHEATGWYLPVDELSPLLASNSDFWKVWCKWRQKQCGDFFYDLKVRLKAINPKVVFMGYTTHYGLTSTYGTLNQGQAIEQSARTWDFIGTEIMSRNIYASYRSVNTLRKVKNFLKNTYGCPTFGLVYSVGGDWGIQYFGWALNNLNGQSTWEIIGNEIPKGKADYKLFTPERGNMSLRTAKDMSKVAMVFSAICRDWPKNMSYPPDLLGYSQMLSALHIPHEFLGDPALTVDSLAKYDVLLLNNTMNMADSAVKSALQFAENGGTLMLTCRTAIGDGNGKAVEKWPFEEVLGINPLDGKIKKAVAFVWDDDEYKVEAPVFVQEYKGNTDGLQLSGEATLENGQTVPVLMERAWGKGRIIYTPFAFGVNLNMNEFTAQKPMTFEPLPVSETLLKNILKKTIGNATPWHPGNTPENVVTGIFKDGEEVIVHFLNASGANVKKGDMVPAVIPEDGFPQLAEDIMFSVKKEDVTEVYAASPDFEGNVPLSFVNGEDGTCMITLPADKLQVYTLVHIK